jgi:nucleotide-binding universal stress UspA family protein
MIEKVVMPVDFSPRDAAAAHCVKQLRRKMNFETTLLHVIPPPDYDAALLEAGGAALQAVLDARDAVGRDKLAVACAGELAGMEVERVLRAGFPADEIVEFCAERKADLIVMPTHGYGPFRRFLLGSVTSKVLHDAPCAVMTGAHLEEAALETMDFGVVGVAIDLSENSTRVLEYGARLARVLGAKLAVIHAMTGLKGMVGMAIEPDYALHFESAVRARMRELTHDLPADVELLTETGEAAATVVELARAAKVELLVIGRGTSGALGRLRAQSYAIIRESPVPVVSV